MLERLLALGSALANLGGGILGVWKKSADSDAAALEQAKLSKPGAAMSDEEKERDRLRRERIRLAKKDE